MWTAHGIHTLPPQPPSGMTIGAFDGVHLGHQALIRWFVHEAHEAHLQAVVLTFDPLPRRVLHTGEFGLIASLEDRVAQLSTLGVDGVIIQPFTFEFAALSALDFVTSLIEHVNLRGLWVGSDFALGRGREGDTSFLQQTGQRLGFSLRVMDHVVLWQGEQVRSTRIRRALRQGNLHEANGCLGRPYRLRETVVHGEQRGRTLGFPTANLVPPPHRLLPANGVYICRATLPQGQFAAITNIGTRPTFDHHTILVEAHLLDFEDDIYGCQLTLDFLHRLRAERKFPSVSALVTQLEQDKQTARTWLHMHPTKIQHRQ